MSNRIVGDDIETALSIIEANGGAGDFEDFGELPDETNQIQRWLFPRFAGAEHIGTCDSTAKAHTGFHAEVKACKNWSVDVGNMYLSRSGVGNHDTDIETVAAWLSAPRNMVGGVMLLGNPGTGKTAMAQAACTFADRKFIMLTATPDDTKDSLRMRFVGEGKGEGGTPYIKASLARAAIEGLVVIVDEFMLYVDGVKPLWYPLLDGSPLFPEGNVDGTDLMIHPDFRVIVTANPDVRGASLPEPIASRFASTTVTVETAAPMLRDLGIDEAIVAAWEALGTSGLWRPEIRELRLADYWLGVDVAQSVSAFVPEHCPETQRVEVTNVVAGFLGGAPRTDGRLVVS